MNVEFKECLEKKKLVRFSLAKRLVKTETEQAKNDLVDAKDSLKAKKYKWATIQAYYSMFHAGRSLIYRKGYREKSHYALMIALKTLYSEEGWVSRKILDDFQTAKNLREEADYHATYSKEGAQSLVETAEDFINLIEQKTEK
jgi:uncharacterized protein (UPF0332 family)